MASVPIERAELARSDGDRRATRHRRRAPSSSTGSATSPGSSRTIRSSRAELPAAWRPLLAAYVPEPFRSLG